jgi:DNA-binding MarR family transcriptional regulator
MARRGGAALDFERLARLLRAGEFGGGLNPAQREALRYIARANRFSNAPGALSHYLAATKGTVSQTLSALERKGFIAKSERPGERRSVALALTAEGRAALAGDPWANLVGAIATLGGKTRRRLAKGLAELLDAELTAGNHPSFGSCLTCRYHREGGDYCMKFEVALAEEELELICVAHVVAAK